MFVGKGISQFETQRINYLQAEPRKGYWAARLNIRWSDPPAWNDGGHEGLRYNDCQEAERMKITGSDVILLAHSTFGVLGILSALWVFVETLNAREENARRIEKAAFLAALCMSVTWIVGGYWYVHFYPVDRALILKGPWPWAHTLFMETKEHLFYITLILSFYLPIAARDKLYANAAARKMALCVAMLIVLTGLAIEGSGAIINHGAKVALLHASQGAAR